MSDERPAGGANERFRETPAPGETPASVPPSPVRQGIRAALLLFAAAAAVELVALAGVRLSNDPDGNVAGVFLLAGVGIFVFGLFAALVISGKLPRGARGPFWAMGVVCASLTVVLWGVTCGLAGTPRIGG